MSDLLTSLNDRQREAAEATEGPVLVIAGAGSGKTKALTHRIAYLIRDRRVAPANILAVTFTNKAAGEMKKRVAKLIGARVFERDDGSMRFDESALPVMGTFHSICVRLLRKYAPMIDYEEHFVIYDENDQQILMKQLMQAQQIDDKKMNPRAVLSAISGAKGQLIDSKEYWKYTDSFFTEKVASLYGPYQDALQKNGAMDFDDLLVNMVRVLREHPEVLSDLQEKFRYIMVDEYQDTNHVQYVLIKLLAAKYRNLCVIGDDDQSIYSWRGATVKNILDFEKDYPEAKVVSLEQNYRSTQVILDAAHGVISQNRHRKDKKLWTEREGGENVRIWMTRNERHESEMVVEEILRRLKEYESPEYRDFVVLYRTNAQSRVMEEVMLRYGVPYKIVGGIRFYDRKEIKDLLAYLRVTQNPRDSVSLMRIINVPARKIGNKTLETLQTFAMRWGVGLFEAMERVASAVRMNDESGERLSDEGESGDRGRGGVAAAIDELSTAKAETIAGFVRVMHDLQSASHEASASGVIKHILEVAKYREFLDDGTSEGEERLENVRELISVAKKYDGLEAGMSLRVFLEEVSLLSDADQIEERENSVTMMTVHSAKGLEFANVFVVGVEDGVFPHSRSALDPAQLEEERRLMYVAVTRAKERLYLVHAEERLLYGEYKSNAPSQFLDDIPVNLVDKNYRSGGDGVAGGTGDGFGRVGVWGGSGKRSAKFAAAFSEERAPGRVVRVVPFEEVEGGYVSGDHVEHPAFGPGVVMNVVGGIITVVFEDSSVGTKKLALSIAPLRKME